MVYLFWSLYWQASHAVWLFRMVKSLTKNCSSVVVNEWRNRFCLVTWQIRLLLCKIICQPTLQNCLQKRICVFVFETDVKASIKNALSWQCVSAINRSYVKGYLLLKGSNLRIFAPVCNANGYIVLVRDCRVDSLLTGASIHMIHVLCTLIS